MVIINTTGKINEVWLDKPYGTIIVDCPDTGISWESGYTSGYTDGLAACSGSPEDWQDGYDSGHTDGFQDGYDSGRTDGYDDGWGPGYDSGRTDGYDDGWWPGYESGFTDGHESGYTDGWQPGYDSGYTDGYNAAASGNPGYDEGYEVGFDAGYTSGVTDQKNKLTSTAITQNGTYTRPDGWSSFTVTVAQTGYTQADLDAAFQSGITYQKSLLTYTAITGNGIYTSENGFGILNIQVACPSAETSGIMETVYLRHTSSASGSASGETLLLATRGLSIVKAELADGTEIPLPSRSGDLVYYGFPVSGLNSVKYTLTSNTLDMQFATGYLIKAIVPSGVTELSSGLFQRCRGLSSITIPEGVEKIYSDCFYSATSLPTMVFPSTVNYLGRDMIKTCVSITGLTFLGTTPPTLDGYQPVSDALVVRTPETDTFPIYVPASAVNTYKTAWPQYASRIFAIQ